MSAAHMHLMFNHLPIIGSLLGLLIFALARWRKSRDMELAGLLLLLLAALFALPTYFSGAGAEAVVEDLPTFAEQWIEPHEDFARIALLCAIILGALGAYGLWLDRSRERLSNTLAGAVLVVGLVAAGAFGYTAYLGGQVAHPELRPGGVAANSPADAGAMPAGEQGASEGDDD